jgi:hypothetical protein
MNSFWNELVDKKALSMFQKAYRAANRRALKRGIPFEISVDDIIHQYIDQDGKCFYSNLEMKISKDKGGALHDPYKMTLDCKDPMLGYKKQNIVWCIYCINSFKQRMPKEEVINICYSIIKHNEKE